MTKSNHRPTALDRLVQEAMGEGREIGRDSDPAAKAFPELWRWLSTVYLGRDTIKQPASLAIRLGPQGVLVSLIDRDLCVSIDVACAHLEQAYAAVEQALTGENTPVKSWGKREPHLRKRRST